MFAHVFFNDCSKVLADSLIATSIDVVAYISFMKFTEHFSAIKVKESLAKDFVHSLFADELSGLVMQTINYGYVLVKYQLTFANKYFCWRVVYFFHCRPKRPLRVNPNKT